MKIKVKCDNCNKILIKFPCRIHKHNFCNNKCNSIWLGKFRKPETNLKISNSMKGKKHHFFGKKRPEHSKFMSKFMLGKMLGVKNPNWKGGISCEPYCDVWLDKEYKESIKERDGYMCLNPQCSKFSLRLCLHHINYNKKDCSPNNLITLCNSCNCQANFERLWHKSWYNAIINRRYKINENNKMNRV